VNELAGVGCACGEYVRTCCNVVVSVVSMKRVIRWFTFRWFGGVSDPFQEK